MPVVLVHPDHGVFVGQFSGIPFWSRGDSGGQFQVVTFPDEEKARQFIAEGRTSGMFEDGLDFSQARFVAVEATDYASIDALVKAGLADALGDLRWNEAKWLIDHEIHARQPTMQEFDAARAAATVAFVKEAADFAVAFDALPEEFHDAARMTIEELVYDLVCDEAATQMNQVAEMPQEQADAVLSEAEGRAANINNEGVHAQLAVLHLGRVTMDEIRAAFVDQVPVLAGARQAAPALSFG